MRVWPGIFLVLLCAILPANARAQGKSFALLVGVDEYFYGQGFPKLEYCAKDADAIHETLIDDCQYSADNVKLLVSKGANPPLKQNVLEALQEIMKQATDEDTVLFYFSGHGLEVDKSGLISTAATPEKDRQGVLATADCDIRKPGKTGLLVSEVKRILAGDGGRKSPKCKFLILDCCHAGAGGTKGATAAHAFTEQLGGLQPRKIAEEVADFEKATPEHRGTITLASCLSHQKSLEDKVKKQGLFTYYLVQGLSGKANRDHNAVVDHLELYSYLAQKVPEAAKRIQATAPNRRCSIWVPTPPACSRWPGWSRYRVPFPLHQTRHNSRTASA